MVKFNMIDTQSMGIRKVFRIQQEKYFPLPDYDLLTHNKIEVTVYGDDKQKESKVRNLLKKLRAEGIITTDSDNKRLANWVLKK